MSLFIIAAVLAQAAAPPPPADRDAVCWAGAMDAYFRAHTQTNGPPAARDSGEERLREIMGYYMGVIRTRYPTEATLGPAMRLGWVGFQRGDRRQIVQDCLTAYHRVLQDVSPLVRPLMRGE